MGRNYKWGRGEVDYLKENYDKMTAEQISKKLNRNLYSVRNKLKALDMKKEKQEKRLKMNKEELIYFAGLIDGEGSFFITNHSTKNKQGRVYYYYEPFLSVGNCSLQFRDYLKRYGLPIRKEERKIGWQDKYVTLMGFSGLRGVLKQLIPHLILKKGVAILMLDYIEEKMKNKGKETKRVKELRNKIKLINSKNREGLYNLENKIVKEYSDREEKEVRSK